MSSALKRSIAFLLVLVLAISMIPTAFAAEVEPTDSTVPDAHAAVTACLALWGVVPPQIEMV